MHAVDLIRCVRDRQPISPADLHAFAHAIGQGAIPDYQAAAFLMAVYLNGLSDDLTTALTIAMRDSGVVIQHPNISRPAIDKHSTGGVGDKISIPLAPLVAACGVPVPMIAGRGLGHTGGTLDKLEAIPGFSVNRTYAQFTYQVAAIGVCIMGQTAEIAPADRKLYALRDVTATIESIPLITASILSKKLAAGLNGLVMDIKVGRGAFMKDIDAARALAQSIVRVGKQAGLNTRAVLTRMDDPLGFTIGNALEVRESIALLQGHGPQDTAELTLTLGVEMLLMGGVARNASEARHQLQNAIASGRGLEKFGQMIEAQGGDPRVCDDPHRLPKAPHTIAIKAQKSGYIHSLDALALGQTAMRLGAGRLQVTDTIDPAVGVEILHAHGAYVQAGDDMLLLHCRHLPDADQINMAQQAIGITDQVPEKQSIVLEKIG